MKKFIFIIIFIITVTMALPVIIVELPPKSNNSTEITKNVEKNKKKETPKIKVYITSEDRVEEMDTNQYLKEVVAAEMPVSFHDEALKAQAVAARTYMLSRQNSGPTDIHKGACICTDPTHCKAWASESDRKDAWGNNATTNWSKISNAVESTDGIIITYENQPISAVFHSTSSGQTENAKDVWGGDIPYLVSVSSIGDVQSPKYKSQTELSIDKFKEICEKNINGVNWDNGLFSDIHRSNAGGITSITIGGIKIKGTELRTIFSLRSTNIDIKEEDNKIIMNIKGYGHGVGMSQYGANYLANQGKTYTEILKTYYTGVEIKNLDNLSN